MAAEILVPLTEMLIEDTESDTEFRQKHAKGGEILELCTKSTAQKRSPKPLWIQDLLSEGDGNRTRNHRIDRNYRGTPEMPVFPEDSWHYRLREGFCKPLRKGACFCGKTR